jgi:hypothetical protein
MLAKNILAIVAFVVAASATPVADLEKRNPPCGQNQVLKCCESVDLLTGVGIGCVSGKANPYKISHFEPC